MLLAENSEFRSFWAGQLISLFGDEITLLAVPLLAVLLLHAEARQMGYLAAAGLAPNLLFALHAGAWVDRRGRRRQMMMAADIGRAVLLATVPVAYALERLTMIQLYAVAFLMGTLTVLFWVSYSALFVSIVPRDRYVEGNAILQGSRAFSLVGGPSLGGLIVQVLLAAVRAPCRRRVISCFGVLPQPDIADRTGDCRTRSRPDCGRRSLHCAIAGRAGGPGRNSDHKFFSTSSSRRCSCSTPHARSGCSPACSEQY